MGLNSLMIPVSYGSTQCYAADSGSFNFHFIARIYSCFDFIQTVYSDCNVSTYSNYYLVTDLCVHICIWMLSYLLFHTRYRFYTVFIVLLYYLHSPKSLATLQPVKKRGTSIHWNGHNIPNTACILFKLGTMNNRHMPNSKPMKV